MPISFVQEGKSVMIKDIQMNEKMGKKIKEMGVNREIEIIKNDGSSLIIGISGSRLAISKGMAQKILAE